MPSVVPVSRLAMTLAGAALAVIQGVQVATAADLPQVLTGINARFQGADLPVVTGNNMVINQTADRATLHWQSFNIGAGNKVEFKQPDASSVALNRIFDGVPSEIRGQLQANGQIYLINANGIVFASGARVDTQSLVASTLDISDVVFEEIGFVNAINAPDGARPAFESFGRPMGEIRIADGASLAAESGGRILIFAPTIVNEGTISTPEGQQVLAAAKDRVLIAASTDPNLRGLLVEVSTGGDVTNVGSLLAERGNITLLGLAVNQQGIARATTGVALNGSIRLVAQDMAGTLALSNDLIPRAPKPVRGGELRLGTGSVTEVVPDRSVDKDGKEIVALDAQTQPRSQLRLTGRDIEVGAGARATATGGNIVVTAAVDPFNPDLGLPGDPANSPARIVLRPGAVIDASGDASAKVSVARNVVAVEARGNELADSPVQRDGPIRNKTLQVDLRKGTDFLNIEGPVAAIGRTAAERQSVGGVISMASEGAIVLEAGAALDVSGGAVTYTTGTVRTSQLRQANGIAVDISSADPNLTYTGLAADNVRVEQGYVEGRDAGQVSLQARGITLDGGIAGGTVPGPNQRRQPVDLAGTGVPDFARPFDQAPLGGGLALALLRSGLPELALGAAPADGVPALTLSSEFLAASGLTRIGVVTAGPIRARGTIELPAWSTLNLTAPQVELLGDIRSPGGSILLNSSSALTGALVLDRDLLVRIDGRVDLSGTWVNDSPLVNRGRRGTAPEVLNGGSLAIDSGATIDLAPGSVIDVGAGAFLAANGRFTGGRGGVVELATRFNEDDSSLGAPVNLAGTLRGFGFTRGSELRIATERLEILADSAPPTTTDITLDGARQFGLREVVNAGGASQFILQVFGSTFQQGGFSRFDLTATRGDFVILSGAELPLRTATYQLGNDAALRPTGTDLAVLATPALAPAFARPVAELRFSVSDEVGNLIGAGADLTLAAGARIVADAGSRVSLGSTTSLFVEGAIEAPGGQVELFLGGGPAVFLPQQQIWLGDSARIAVDGVALVDDLNPRGLRFGEALDGGRVNVLARQGSIFAASGARITADGTTAVLDIGAGYPRPATVASAGGTIELSAAEALLYTGSLSAAAPAGTTVPGGRLLVGIDPNQRGFPFLLGPDDIPRGPHRVVMEDYAGVLPSRGQPLPAALNSTAYLPLAQVTAGGFDALEVTARSSATNVDPTTGAPVPDTPQALPIIEFRRDLELALDRSIVLDAAILQTTSAKVVLAAPYVAIGYGDTQVQMDGVVPDKTSATNPLENSTPLRLTPTTGTGLLTVRGQFVELVGDTATRGFGNASTGLTGVELISTGDLRLRGVRKLRGTDYSGVFRTAGDLIIEAQRVYPTTLAEFEVSVEGAGGRLVIGGAGEPPGPPLSVGARLALNADTIVQGGALYAPLGDIRFNASSLLQFSPASLTSVSAEGVRAPFFRTEPGGSLVLPAPSTTETQLVFVANVNEPLFERLLPGKQVTLAAPVVELQPGSRFDLRGGGDINATEFVPGPGGTRDILLADLDRGPGVLPNTSFAILPGFAGVAPYDPLETPAASSVQGLKIGDTLVLDDGLPSLPAGEYAVLPARYALFGGFLVTPTGLVDVTPGEGLQRNDGIPILAGRLGVAGNEKVASRTAGFAVETGAQVRQRAEYLESPLQSFYGGVARNPDDAGNLVVNAGTALQLQGQLIRDAVAAGRGSTVDIATAAAIRIVGDFTGLPGIELRAADLVNLGADSLLLGGTRAEAADEVQLTATSSEVSIAAGVDLEVPELVLVGRRLVVDSSPGLTTQVASTAAITERATQLRLDGDAAILAVSGQQLTLARGATPVAGVADIVIGSGATITAPGSLILDAVRNIDQAGRLSVPGGLVSLGASRISLGEIGSPVPTGGLVLDNVALAALAGDSLRLRSREIIDVYGELRGADGGDVIAFADVVIDAPGLRGLANDGRVATLATTGLELRNTSGSSAPGDPGVVAPGSGLELQSSGVVTLGTGTFALSGVESVTLLADAGIAFTGTGTLLAPVNLSLQAPVIVGGQAARRTLTVGGSLEIAGREAAPGAALPAPGLAATLDVTAADIDVSGRILLPSGFVRLTQTGNPGAPTGAAGLRLNPGTVIDVAGQSQVFGPRTVATPGGWIDLTAATGDLVLASGAVLDLAGAVGGGEAGELRLQAPLGNLVLGSGLQVRATDPDASTGIFRLDAAGLVASDAAPGSGVAALAALLGEAGFRDQLAIRLRQQDVTIDAASSLRAREIRLVSDGGTVAVAGLLDASGEEGGRIWLAAGDQVDITGALNARSTRAGATGGRVDLFALDADGDDAAGLLDTVNFRAGAAVDVSGGDDGEGGKIAVHVRRLDANSDGQTDRIVLGDLDGTLIGAGTAELVATRVLRNPGAIQVTDPVSGEAFARVTIGTSQINAWRNETGNFLANLAAPAVGAFTVTPGLQVESTGELILQNRWDFEDGWHFGRDFSDAADPQVGVVGTLMLRAGRILDLRADLTDAFSQQLLFGFLPYDGLADAVPRRDGEGSVVGEVIPTAWTYRLAAGADLGSADVQAVTGRTAELRLGQGVRLRTGTGDIDVAASGDVRLLSGAAVYSAGFDRGLSAQLQEAIAASTTDFGLTAYDFFGTFLNGGQFAAGGGTVTINAGGNLRADVAPATATRWLTRVGSGAVRLGLYDAVEGFGAVPTHWAAVFDQFRNGIGAFGGGDLNVAVGGNVNNVALALPTTGRVVDGVVADTTGGVIVFQPSVRSTEILGGGTLRLRSDGSVIGSQVTLGRGEASLRSGGSGQAQVLLGGDATIDWVTGGDLQLTGLQDPTVRPLDPSQLTLLQQVFSNITSVTDIDNRFYTYTDATQVRLRSTGGDLRFDGNAFAGFLPPSLTAVAFGGDITVVPTPLDFFPAPSGQLELLAGGNVTGNFIGSTEARLRQSDQDPATLPSVSRPDVVTAPLVPARVPVRSNDPRPNLVIAREGSVQSQPGRPGYWNLELAKATVIQAGLDIRSLFVRVQNIRDTDLTSLLAGRDIVQPELRSPLGKFDPGDRRIFEIWGPGSAEFIANRNISLGTSAGIETIGNTRNPSLSPTGASLRLWAGTGGEPAYDRFIEVYLSAGTSEYRDAVNAFLADVDAGRAGFNSSAKGDRSLPIKPGAYLADLEKFLAARGIPVAGDDPVATFRGLDQARQRDFITQVMFAELKDWGSASETPDRADRLNYLRGYAAIDTLFAVTEPLAERAAAFEPGAVTRLVTGFLSLADQQAANDAQAALFGAFFPERPRQGDINLLLSQVQTLAGGGLTMLAPGGDINAGAADADVINKEPADLGIVTALPGNIDIFVDKDLLVNSTRVFALQGDLLLWSSNGNIDAGKGAKTVTSVPDPITSIDPNTGNTIIEFPPAVAGSGLQGQNAALFAPRGAVNAGDAGIRTSGDLTIGAIQVIGTDNISVGGVQIGFSTSDAVAVAPPGAAAAVAAASQGVDAQGGLGGEEDELGDRLVKGTEVSFIRVDVLSFGTGVCGPDDEDCD